MMFGMGTGEIIVIMIIALIIFGPGKLPGIMGDIGRTVREFKRQTRDLTAEFESSISDVQSTMGEMKAAVTEVQRETSAIAASIPEAIEGTNAKPSTSSASAATTATATQATIAGAATIFESHGASTEVVGANGVNDPIGPTATKDDPFADLAELDQDPQPAQPPAAVR